MRPRQRAALALVAKETLVPFFLAGAGAVVAALLLLYCCLETKTGRQMLPQSWWAPLSKLCFWPLLLPNYARRRLAGKAPFTDIGEGILCGETPLVFTGDVRRLHRDGVRAVVNMQAEYRGPIGKYARMEPPVAQLHIPVTDHIEPSVDDMEAAVEFIARHRANGERVLIHCKGGHGRSAAVAAAWLIHSEGLTPEGAQRRLSSVRRVRKSLHLQPAVLSFYARYERRR